MITDSEINALRNEFVRKEDLHVLIARAVQEALAAQAEREALTKGFVSSSIKVTQESANASKN